MTNKSVLKTYRSRLAVAAVGLGLAVAGAACSEGNPATSPSALSPTTLAGKPNAGEDTRNFDVTITPTVNVAGGALHVTVTREDSSGKDQQLGAVEIYVPAGLTLQSVSNFSPNWTGSVSGQTVRVGAVGGNHKLDSTTKSVEFDIFVMPTADACDQTPFTFTAAASNNPFRPFTEPPLNLNWTHIGLPLSVTVIGCAPPVVGEPKAAPDVANDYLDSIKYFLDGRGNIIKEVAQHMTQGARFDGIEKSNVEAYKAAVIAFVIPLL